MFRIAGPMAESLFPDPEARGRVTEAVMSLPERESRYIIDYPELVEMGMHVTLFAESERAPVGALHDWILAGGESVLLIEPMSEPEPASRLSAEGSP